MPSPFPGMDPYLESRAALARRAPLAHHRCRPAASAAAQSPRLLSSTSRAGSGWSEPIATDLSRTWRVLRQTATARRRSMTATGATLVADEPVRLWRARNTKFREDYLQIYETATKKLDHGHRDHQPRQQVRPRSRDALYLRKRKACLGAERQRRRGRPASRHGRALGPSAEFRPRARCSRAAT